MDQALRHYLSQHGEAVNSTSLSIAEALADPHDTDRDTRRLIHDSREALQKAIHLALNNGPVEGLPLGAAGDVVVVVQVPQNGQTNSRKLAARSARLVPRGTIPVPSDWAQEGEALFLGDQALHRLIFTPPSAQRILELDDQGRADFGGTHAGGLYLFEELPDGAIWLRPLASDAD